MIGVREPAFGNLIPLLTICLLYLQQVDKRLLNTVKEPIRQGFSWATREGPLCEERKYISTSRPCSFIWHCTCRYFIWTRPSRGLSLLLCTGARAGLRLSTCSKRLRLRTRPVEGLNDLCETAPTLVQGQTATPHTHSGGAAPADPWCSSHLAVRAHVDPLQLSLP